MILIKGFLKHKSSKIYIVILTIMLLAITIIFKFFQYYSNLITNIYQENSYFLAISKDDIIEKIIANNYIVNIRNVALLDPNKENFSENINDTVLLDQGNNFIIVIPNQIQELMLEDNQIAIELPKFVLNNDTELSLIGKRVYFKVKDKQEKFEIIKTYESNFARVIVSHKTFEYLTSNNDYNAYIFTLNDYSKIEEITYYFEMQENVQINFIQFYDSEALLNTIEALEKTINWLSYGCIVIIAVFLILFIIITCNIIHDEFERMHIERLLGYNKLQIKKYIIMKIASLNLIVIFFYAIAYVGMNLVIMNFM